MNVKQSINRPIELHFVLNVVQEWPPVAIEGLPCTQVPDGYRVDQPPLFVKGISCGDVIAVVFDSAGNVASWRSIHRSHRSTVWILRTGPGDNIASVLVEVQAIKCRIAQLPQLGCYSIDVPEEVAMLEVDSCLAHLDSANAAVVYPSFRHEEE